MNATTRCALLLTVLTAAGCAGDSAGRGPLVAIRDSAGIAIAENPSPDDSALHAWWRVEGPALDIGGEDAVEPYVLHRVAGALRAADGGVIVGNAGAWDVRVYDAAGQHVRTTGRRGGGPGEFQSINGLLLGGSDSVLVIDSPSRRISVLAPDGSFARETTMPGGEGFPVIVGRLEDGSLLGWNVAVRGDQLSSDPNAIQRPPVRLVRFSPELVVLDTLGEFPGAERIVRVDSRDGQIVSIQMMSPPFAKTGTFAVHDRELYVATQDAPEVRVHEESGELRRIIRTGRAPEPITEAHLDALLEEWVAAAPPEREADVRARPPSEVAHGETVPPYGTIMIGRNGHLWMADYNDPLDPPGRWTVYGADGGVIARIVLPDRFRPYDIGEDWILGRELDELDVEHIRLYRLVKP